jgi:hypothetical protein
LNPEESIPTNSRPIFVRIINDEIIFSSRVPLILSFCEFLKSSEMWYMW